MTIATEYLNETRSLFRSQKQMLDKTLVQLSDEELFWQPGPESNSVAVIVKHLAGNMISRWTDFLTSDGEKPDRDRDSEFVTDNDTASSIKSFLDRGYKVFFDTLDSLTEDDLIRTVMIRREPHTVIKALQRQVSHYGYHIGQIVYIAKMIRKEQWKTLSIPKGKSAEYLVTPPVPRSS
ncbi:MAG TPA: DUF1572 family protein [Candidatus Kapabacteria bacterium]|nr:DUF1572 family protein [Candidatus Kapabacteria bacterium]